MKQVLHKTWALSMALLVVLSTISFTVDKHYCMGHLVDVALFVKADGCGMQMDESAADTVEFTKVNSCCSNTVDIVKGQDNLNSAKDVHVLKKQEYKLNVAFNFVVKTPLSYSSTKFNEYYPPPKIVRNIQLLDQVFLI